jgi:MSHA pilin protein MshC
MCTSPGNRQYLSLPLASLRGFTMVELIVVTMLVAILSAVAYPKLDSALSMRNDSFKEGLVAGLRYAARTAVAQRRLVCATVSNTQLALRIANANVSGTTMSCDTDLLGPGVGNVFVVSDNASSQVTMTQTLNGVSSSYSGAIYFQPDGRATASAAGGALGTLLVSPSGASGTVMVIGESAHVE